MRLPRIFHGEPLSPGLPVELDETAHRHLTRVLRLGPGDRFVVFDGRGGEYLAVLEAVDRKTSRARLERFEPREAESPLEVTLAQGIAKGERMDFAIQKSVELGIHRLVPLHAERSVVQLRGERMEKKLRHWRGVAVAAAEQCGRNRIPEVTDPRGLQDLLREMAGHTGLVLHPEEGRRVRDIPLTGGPVLLLVGPEGGFSEAEVDLALRAGCHGVSLGPRVLRTETAGLAALTALQALHGDL